MLQINDLSVRYGAIEALRGISLQVAAGEVVALIGANGAGKSTLMKAISGLAPAAAGAITFDGADITRVPAHQRVQRGIAQSPEGRQVFADQTVRENLMLGAWSRPGRAGWVAMDEDIERHFETFPVLRERQHQLAGTMSGGEQQMLAIARALMARPRLLLLDEPSLGLAPLIVRDIFSVIRRLKQQGMTLLLVEQMAHQALQVADRAYVLKTGEITTAGTAQALLADPAVREAYLGRH